MPGVNDKRKKNKSSKRACHNCCCLVPKRRKIMQEELQTTAKYTASTAIDNNSLQYEENLPKELKTGSVIAISGTIHFNCSRFAINLLCKKSGSRTTEDIAFHFNPRLDRRYIVRNCCIGGEWGEEETTSIQKFLFQRSQKFNLHIFVAEEKFLVSLNGKHICGFVLRLPLSKVTKIEIEGFVDVHGVEYREIQTYPEPVPENEPTKIGTSVDVITSQELDVPYTGLLPMVLKEGNELEIYGRVKILPHSFCINIQKGSQIWPQPTIVLNLNVKFGIPTHILSMNCCENGKWGHEQRIPTSQFVPGSEFKLTIQRIHKNFKIWNAETLIGEYHYKGSIEESNIVYIQGDIVVKHIYFHK